MSIAPFGFFILGASLVLTSPLGAQPTTATQTGPVPDTREFRILDDPELTKACLAARELFLGTEPMWQPGKENRLDFTLLVIETDGTIRRGGYGQDRIAYPASCVKLPFMVAAMKWCRENGLPPTALDSAVRPMITVSSNEATGEVVDVISGAANLDDLTTATDPRFAAWMEKRSYTADFLESRGLLGNQTILHKTYPSNSGRSPAGSEKVANVVHGGNRMQPRLSASLMLEVALGRVEPQAHGYMMQMLRHERFEDDSVVGWGLPPGTEFFNKPGVAYDTCEDIAYARLPNGRQFVLAAYSNSLDRPQPIPHDANRLGRFTEILMAQTGLTRGLTTVYAPGTGVPGNPQFMAGLSGGTRVAGTRAVTSGTQVQGSIGDTTRTVSSPVPVIAGLGDGKPVAEWTLELPAAGHYELVGFHPAGKDLSTSAVVTIEHADGVSTVALNQRMGERRPKPLGTYRFGANPWKSPQPGPLATVTQARIRLSAPIGHQVAADTFRAQLWMIHPPGTTADPGTAEAP